MDTTDDEDATRMFLSKMVLQGESIIAEIVRLSTGFVPKEFSDTSNKSSSSSSRFKPILYDFRYFEKSEQIEAAIEKDTRLQTLFYSTHGPVITAFEQLFNSIFEFINTFQRYCDEFRKSIDSKVVELEINCLYVCGVLLQSLDQYLPAPTRERLYIAVFRRCDNRVNAEFLVDFLKASTSTNDTLIRRAAIPSKFVLNCIGELENLPIESCEKMAMMYTCLLFDKRILVNETARMNKIVNLIYREQWVFNIGYGILVNLFDAWYPHKAAWNALNSMISTQEANRIAEKHLEVLRTSVLTPKSVADMADLEANLRLIRNFNSSLRWVILHSRPSPRGKTIANKPSDSAQFQWLVDVSRFELDLLTVYRTTLKNRGAAIANAKRRTCAQLAQLGEFFAHGFGALQGAQKDNFVAWVRNLRATVEAIGATEEDGAKDVQQVQRRLKQVGELLGVDANYTLREMLNAIDAQLRALATLLAISEANARRVCDAAAANHYLWPLIDWLRPMVGDNLVSTRCNANVVRQVFAKMSLSVGVVRHARLDPLCGGTATCGEVAARISNAWSAFLERHLRQVLQTVPRHLFDLLNRVVMPALASRIDGGFVEKSQLKALESNPSRARLVEATYTITNMSMGISRMMLRRVGTLPINPRQLLEDGLIRELYKEIKRIMGLPTAMLGGIEKFAESCERLKTLRAALIYMCEFMSLDGEMIWCAAIDDYFARMVEEGRSPLLEMIGKRTDPKTTRYLENRMVWSEAKNPKIEVSSEIFTRIDLALPLHALVSLQTVLLGELEHHVHTHFSTWRKLGGNSSVSSIDDFTSAEFERLVRTVVLPKSGEIAAQMARIGQLVLVLKAIGESRRVCDRIRENRMHRELAVCNRFMCADPSELPAYSPILVRLMIYYSLFDPRNLLFNIRAVDDVAPVVLLLAFLQCVVPKIGESSFVCPLQLAAGFRFVARQTRVPRDTWQRLCTRFIATWQKSGAARKQKKEQRRRRAEQFLSDVFFSL